MTDQSQAEWTKTNDELSVLVHKQYAIITKQSKPITNYYTRMYAQIERERRMGATSRFSIASAINLAWIYNRTSKSVVGCQIIRQLKQSRSSYIAATKSTHLTINQKRECVCHRRSSCPHRSLTWLCLRQLQSWPTK